MKNAFRLFIFVIFALLIAIPLAGCTGPEGGQGVQGEQGEQGPEGEQGPAGPAVGFHLKNSEEPYDIPGIIYLETAYFAEMAGFEPDEEVILSTYDYPDGNFMEITRIMVDSRGVGNELVSLPSTALYGANAIYAWVDDNDNSAMDDGELRACLPCYIGH